MNYKFISKFTFPTLISLILISISVFYYFFTSNNIIFGLFSDDAVYLLQAELYSPWHLGSSPVAEYIRERSFFPPLFPFLLGIFGVDSNNLISASNINASCLLIALFCTGCFTYSVTHSKSVSIILPCVMAFLPDTLLFSQGLWSEFLFMCMMYAAFIFIDADEISSENWLLSALLVSLSSLTRSIGVALIFALFILLLIKRPKYYLYYISIICIPFFTWISSRYLLVGDANYISSLFEISGHLNISKFFDLLQQKTLILSKASAGIFSGYASNNLFVKLIMGVFLLLALIGHYLRLKQYKLDSLFTPFYLLIIIMWPYTDLFFTTRFIYPLIPLLLIYITVALHYLFTLKHYQYISYCIVFSLIIFMAAPTSTKYIKRGLSNVEPTLKPYTRTRHWLMSDDYENAYKTVSINKKIIESLSYVSNYVPDKECIYAIQSPFVMLYTKRISLTYPSINNNVDEFEKNTRACNYFIAMPMTGAMIKHSVYYPFEVVNNNPGYKIIPITLESSGETEIIIFLIRRILNRT